MGKCQEKWCITLINWTENKRDEIGVKTQSQRFYYKYFYFSHKKTVQILKLLT